MESTLEIKSLDLRVATKGGSRLLFSNINATAKSSELIALIGANGKGKSTLLKRLSGVLPGCGNGSITFNGTPIEQLGQKERSQTLSFVGASSPRQENLTVKGLMSINRYYKTNWIGSLKSGDEQKIAEALEMVGLQGFEERESSVLSDGEYQRVTIAAAIAQETDFIILDEPTAFLDIANRFLVTKLLRDIAHKSGKCIIFSTHDLQSAIQMCDKIWVMATDGFYDDTPKNQIKNNIFNKIFSEQSVIFNKETLSFEEAPDK